MHLRVHNEPLEPVKPRTIGLGEVVAASTKAIGIRPCGACQRRREALNRATPNWLGRFLQKLKKWTERTDDRQK